MLLKMASRLKSLNKAKISLRQRLKNFLENGELRKTSLWIKLLEKSQRVSLLVLDSRFCVTTWLLFLRLNQETLMKLCAMNNG